MQLDVSCDARASLPVLSPNPAEEPFQEVPKSILFRVK